MRSSEYDSLMGAEMKAIEDKRGVHSGKDFLAPRIIDASEVSLSRGISIQRRELDADVCSV